MEATCDHLCLQVWPRLDRAVLSLRLKWFYHFVTHASTSTWLTRSVEDLHDRHVSGGASHKIGDRATSVTAFLIRVLFQL